MEINDGTYIFIINGYPTAFSPHWQKVFIALWMFSLAATCIVSPIEFIFRYLLVVREYTVTYAWLFVMGVVVVLISAHNGNALYWAMDSVDNHTATFGHLMTDPMWKEDGKLATFYAASTVGGRCQELLWFLRTLEQRLLLGFPGLSVHRR